MLKKTPRGQKWIISVLFIFILTSCQVCQKEIEPVIVYTPTTCQIQSLPTAFSPLTSDERQQEWAKELILGDAFARELDLYRAITCYMSALILLPPQAIERRLQIDYDIILCYYLGRKYQEAINTFEASALVQVNPLFPGFNNLMILLQDAYRQVGQEDRAECLFELIEKYSPETAVDLSLYDDLDDGRLNEAQTAILAHPKQERLQEDLDLYFMNAKSPCKARTLNALLPGAGYYYVGQPKSAITSFVINTLFTAAAYQFFKNGYYAAGAITTSLELGWYLGGINGAGIEATEYNSRLYEGVVQNMMIEHRFFPVLMFETAF